MKIRVKDPAQLNELIMIKGFYKTEFGREIGMSGPMTTQITNGDRSPSPRTAKRICEVLECDWSELFEIVKTPQQAAK
ncbi:helix-turn-helix domain-containing protein [Paenibacillus sp. HW567]|uniref:helix-turn-helix domain-containing protein n=1 Tax=Paenibacillus sp. HW567 TaxID=1034769 RepID=UPI000363B67B|nr:helix-turn-helix transcriptional regulator [Paenibacillus sp. HW567]